MDANETISPEEAAARSFYSASYAPTPAPALAVQAEAPAKPAEAAPPSMEAEKAAAETTAQKVFTSMAPPGEYRNHSDTTPDDIRELRDSDPDRKIFTPQKMLSEVIRDDLFDKLTGEGFTDETRKAVAAEWREVAADLGMGGNEIRQFIDTYKHVASLPADNTSAQDWAATSSQWLKDTYGSDAPKMLALAQRFVARDSRVFDLIKANGAFGNHPEIVKMTVHAALRERAKGRLK